MMYHNVRVSFGFILIMGEGVMDTIFLVGIIFFVDINGHRLITCSF